MTDEEMFAMMELSSSQYNDQQHKFRFLLEDDYIAVEDSGQLLMFGDCYG